MLDLMCLHDSVWTYSCMNVMLRRVICAVHVGVFLLHLRGVA